METKRIIYISIWVLFAIFAVSFLYYTNISNISKINQIIEENPSQRSVWKLIDGINNENLRLFKTSMYPSDFYLSCLNEKNEEIDSVLCDLNNNFCTINNKNDFVNPDFEGDYIINYKEYCNDNTKIIYIKNLKNETLNLCNNKLKEYGDISYC